MANSPTICQTYVASAVKHVCSQFPRLYIVHYMYNLLIAGPDQDQLLKAYTQMQQDLEKVGLIIDPEKVQMQAYLGYQLAMDGIKPKKLTVDTSHLKTLHD